MSFLFHQIGLQWKLDMRSKTLLVTFYAVPLAFFLMMGSIFTSVVPDMQLIPSMIVMGVSMGAYIGFPPTLLETYHTDVKKSYTANGIPLFMGILSIFISAFIHLFVMSLLIFLLAPILFDASLPANVPLFFLSLALYILVSLSTGCILGLAVKNQAKLTMFSQLVFLPSIMLSGIMFPSDLLPRFLQSAGKLFPSSWGYQLMLDGGFCLKNLWYLAFVFLASLVVSFWLLKRKKDY